MSLCKKRAACFILNKLNDYKSKRPGCATQLVKDFKLELLATRMKIRRLCIFHQARHGHLFLPIENFLQPVHCQSSRHHHPESFNTIITNKVCFKFVCVCGCVYVCGGCVGGCVPQTILDCNSLQSPDLSRSG